MTKSALTMRISGTRELENLFRELEGSDYIPSVSYEDTLKALQEDNVYLANMRAIITFSREKVTLALYKRYPDMYKAIEFNRRA